MTTISFADFDEIHVIDTEFVAEPGERVRPVCLVARSLNSGKIYRVFGEDLAGGCPFEAGDNDLTVTYFATAEITFFLALGWSVPRHILDLFTEFRCETNGLFPSAGNGLIGALTYHGLDSIGVAEKDAWRSLIMSGGPWSQTQQDGILDYCQTDVDMTVSLFRTVAPKIDLPRALFRGRYMTAVARIQHAGIPIDCEMLNKIERYSDIIKDELITVIDDHYGVYEGRSFKADKFAEYLGRRGIPWPQDDNGRLKLDDRTFREMERQYAEIAPLRALRSFLSGSRANRLEIGKDGRNRSSLFPWGTKTSRNAPSTNKFAFGLHASFRHLIKAPEGYALTYMDYSQQEFGIGAAMSDDEAMIEAYRSGDPYLTFAKQSGLAPLDATKASHKGERDRAKACVLAVQYGMGDTALAQRLNCSVAEARHLLESHRQTYRQFWKWSDGNVDFASLNGLIWSVFGWTLRQETNPRSLANFPMQANGAEILRLACIMGTESGIEICAPVHDAVLFQSSVANLARDIELMRHCMVEASRQVLDGFELRVDVETFAYPDRYTDPRGSEMWEKMCALLERAEQIEVLTGEQPSAARVLMGDTRPSITL